MFVAPMGDACPWQAASDPSLRPVMPTCSCSSPLHDILPVTGLGVFHTWLPMISSGESVVQMSSVGQESGNASHLV